MNNKFAIYFFIKDINQDELDRLQSSLDPWARIQQQLKEKEASDLEKSSEAITDETPTTTSRPFRLFQPFSRYVSRALKYGKKSFHHLTPFLISTLGVSPSLVSRYCEGYSFWGISGP